MILSISRSDERKNVSGLIDAFVENPELCKLANLVIIAGNREDIQEISPGSQLRGSKGL